MPSALCRFCPCPCPGRWPRGFGGRRPRRLLLRPPPPEGLPGPAFIVLSKFLVPDFDSYQFLPDSNCAWANLHSIFPQDCKELLPRVACEYASFCNVTHNCRAHIWVRSPTLENHFLCKPNRSICVS